MEADPGVHCRDAKRLFAVKAICLAASVVAAGPAQSFKIDAGVPDLDMALDTTVRYNAASRTAERDPRLITSPAVDEGNWLFDKNDLVLSRFDLYSEFDLTYRKNYGLRLSAAGWWDTNFPDKSRSDPRFAAVPNYANNEFTDYIDRYYRGPSGEFLDAFVWGNAELGSTLLNVKAGRFAWLPGEFVFGNGGSFTYSMAPNDGRKTDLSPGASAKETALPIGQLGAIWQLNNEFTLMGQYTAEFRPSRISEGGTYWAVADTQLEGPTFISNPTVPRVKSFEGDSGDVALGLKWAPEALDGDAFGLWLRRFDDKTASWANQVQVGAGGARSRPRRIRQGHRTRRPDLQRPARRLGHRRRNELPLEDAAGRAQRLRLRHVSRPRQRPGHGRSARQDLPLPDQRREDHQQESRCSIPDRWPCSSISTGC